MPQAVAVWCEAEGHDVTLVCHTGFEDLLEELPKDIDLAFIGAFSEGALLAYALTVRLLSQTSSPSKSTRTRPPASSSPRRYARQRPSFARSGA
jgi:hypothetical protein